MEIEEDENLQDLLAVDAAREPAEDRALNWYIRCQGIDIVVDAAVREGAKALEVGLDWVGAMAGDESEDWDFRTSGADVLLDFPRKRHRALLEDLAVRQSGWGVNFPEEDVRRAFDSSIDSPDWLRFSDPWEFYAPEAIAHRQKRWAEEDPEDLDEEMVDDVPTPYVRAAQKTGRNAPCPCGSGKKYKKCCLGKEGA